MKRTENQIKASNRNWCLMKAIGHITEVTHTLHLCNDKRVKKRCMNTIKALATLRDEIRKTTTNNWNVR